jgi:hypothetical protein
MPRLAITVIVKFISTGVVILSEAKNLAVGRPKSKTCLPAGRFFVGAEAPPQNDSH